MAKLLVVGLDGATFDLIKPWVDTDDLLVLKKIMAGGISSPLRSTFPPLTGPAWSSFMTGKSPGHHGVFEFFYRKEGSYEQALHNRLNIQGKTLWGRLSEAGYRVGVMGVPLTYPPEQVNGFTITGLLTPPQARDFTCPNQLLSELEDELGQYILRHDEKYRASNPMPFINEQYKILENNLQAALYLIQRKEWDFMMVHFLGTDRISHEFWHVLDEDHPRHDPEEKKRLGNVILDFYRAVDTALGKILAALEEDTGIVIMSDHGFGGVKKFININVWLLKQGYLKLKRKPSTWVRYLLFRLGFNYDRLGRLILRLGLGKQAKKLGRARRESLQRKVFLSLDDVDWSRSTVYSMGNFGQLFINLKGREPEGIVAPGEEYQALLMDLQERLEALVDPETGEKVIEQMYQKDDIYQGPYLEKAPDLMFLTREMEYKVMGLSDFSSPRVFEPVFGTTGHHRMDGILIGSWPGVFRQAEWKKGARIQDLAPTILYLMGEPIPERLDGEVLLDFLTPEFVAANPVRYSKPGEHPEDEQDYSLSEDEEAMLKERLRGLGYVT